MRRFQWHTGGEAKWDNPWGEAGMVIFSSEYPQVNLRDPGAVYIGDDLLLAGARNSQGEYGSKLPLIDAVDGYIVNTIVPNQWWQPSPYNDESDVVIESIQYQIVHGWPFTIMGNHLESLFILINPHDPDQDWLRYSVEPLELQEQTVKGFPAIDQQGFAVLPSMGEDGDMVGLLAPDGTWAGMLTLVGEESPRNMMLPMDYGSAYDGMYFDGVDVDSASSGLWYRGYDSFRGLIDMGQGWTYLEVIAPNGGEVIPAGSTYTIETYHSTPWGNSIVYLKYSLDNGNSWALIDSMWVSEGEFSYSWSVPNVLADSCRISGRDLFHVSRSI